MELNWHVTPCVVPCESEVALTFGSSAGQLLDLSCGYEVSVTPTESTGSFRGPSPWVPLLVHDGVLAANVRFSAEQEHVVIIRRAGQGEPIGAARAYALAPDLHARYPWKGDFHVHTLRSDGRDSPAYVAARGREIGLDFMAITDHGKYAPSLEAIEAFADAGTDLLLLPGEEVHPPDNRAHMINFGGTSSINARFKTSEYATALADYQEKLPALPPDLAMQAASCQWCFDRIREADGLGIFCHPYWFCNGRYDVPLPLTDWLLAHRPFDAVEILGGYYRHEMESADMMIARYQQETMGGLPLPIVGVSDAHDTDSSSLFGWYHTIVFAPTCRKADLISSVKDLWSVAATTIPGECPHYFGPTRLVKFAHFLRRMVLPEHDRLCSQEGRILRQVAGAKRDEIDRLPGMAGQCARLYARLWGHAV